MRRSREKKSLPAPLVIPLALCAIFAVQACYADSDCSGGAPWTPFRNYRETDLWLISTRHLPCPIARADRLPLIKRNINGDWTNSNQQEFLTTLEPDTITCIYVHGNRVSNCKADLRGRQIHDFLARQGGKLRFVIWSWPSTAIPGLIRDARAKTARSDGEAVYLARFLSQMPSDSSTSLIGFSFGARSITGALHLLAGGSLCGNSLDVVPMSTVRARVVLWAAAVPNSWILPGRTHGMASSRVDRLLSMYNSKDPILKYYGLTSKTSNPRALGYRSIAEDCLGDASDVVIQCDVSEIVGRTHAFNRFVASHTIMCAVRRFALGKTAKTSDNFEAPVSGQH